MKVPVNLYLDKETRDKSSEILKRYDCSISEMVELLLINIIDMDANESESLNLEIDFSEVNQNGG